MRPLLIFDGYNTMWVKLTCNTVLCLRKLHFLFCCFTIEENIYSYVKMHDDTIVTFIYCLSHVGDQLFLHISYGFELNKKKI